MAKLVIRIDADDRQQHDYDHEAGHEKAMSEQDFLKIERVAKPEDKESARFVFTKSSPGCVNILFRGRAYQV